MYEAPSNDEMRVLVIRMRGPLWTVSEFVVQLAHAHNAILESFTVWE